MACFLIFFNIAEKRFVDVEGKEEYVGEIEDVPFKEKAKFPQEFFPEVEIFIFLNFRVKRVVKTMP